RKWRLREESNAWRSKLFTIYVHNICNEALWEGIKRYFNEFGVVVDVFIGRNKRQNVSRNTKFAFVRFQYEEEMRVAIRKRNGRNMLGNIVYVQEANYGWQTRRRNETEYIHNLIEAKTVQIEMLAWQ
ncbi:RNA recognition motif domain - like 10, partial [Theobroma cacao]